MQLRVAIRATIIVNVIKNRKLNLLNIIKMNRDRSIECNTLCGNGHELAG